MVHPVQRARTLPQGGTLRTLAMMIVGLAILTGCDFDEYAQSEKLAENIDEHRTGCEVEADALLESYVHWDQMTYYHPGFGDTPEPTPTPRPIRSTEISAKVFMETVWEHGCATGRRDVVGAEQTTLMGLRDKLDILGEQIAALEPTPTPTN